MPQSKRILITGASVAGNAAAWWLSRRGFDVTVVEKASEFRDGGQNVDVRDSARDVLRQMGLEQAAFDHNTGEEGTAWIDDDGEPVAEIKVEDTEGDGPTAEMEILRGDLARLIYEQAKDRSRYRFGDTIASVISSASSAEVTFGSGARESFDVVVVAEGVGSATRELLFAGENEPHYLDLTIGYFTIPRIASDDQLWRWYHTTHGRSISLRPDNHGTTRAMLTVQKPSEGENDWDADRQKAWLKEQFADAGWQAERVLDGLDKADDFYFEALRQVRMPRWSEGRVVLLGDAAWCVTPLGGRGASFALIGAYVLAGELGRHRDDPAQAFVAYDKTMRPLIDKVQDIPKLGARLMNPHSRLGIRLMHGAMRLATSEPVREISAKFMSGKNDEFELPTYEPLTDR